MYPYNDSYDVRFYIIDSILILTLKGDIGRAFPQSVMQEVCRVVYRMPVDSTFDEVCI